ncbi:MAG: hypothetical protein QF811_03100 [Candidatus Woesearchaeota archaeon]|jgi:hypothetical protein|nr:hypothetical protein [Candidatus Woesearchaeota archaeon]|tara:strand:+ start:102 stop:671 length:570 start_codon:yes stop_codon:yes gene_type:complete
MSSRATSGIPLIGRKNWEVINPYHQIIWGGGSNEKGAAYKAVRIGTVLIHYHHKEPEETTSLLEVLERSVALFWDDTWLCFDRVGLDGHGTEPWDKTPYNVVSDHCLGSYGDLILRTDDQRLASELAFTTVKWQVDHTHGRYQEEPRELPGAQAWAERLTSWNGASFKGVRDRPAFQEALKRAKKSETA